MSIRRKNRRYLNENLQDLLEMDLFEAEGDEEGDDMDDMGDMDSKDMGDEPMDDESMEEDLEGMSAKDLANELDKLSGELSDLSSSARGLGGESADMSEDSDEDADEDADEGDLELDLAGLFESEGDEIEDDVDETLSAQRDESRRNSGDVILEIDERMLKREISKMKNLREGEAKEMASHFGGGSVDGEVFVDGVELNKLHEIKMKAAKVVRMNRMLERKLSQHKKALRKMKGQLTEMNLFNAKLLYANKLMQNRDLSINQQKNIVESLDGAKNISEAKILFESLTKSLSGKKRTGNRRLSEGSLRRTRGSSSQPVKSAQTINENVALDRWATLAGIKK